MSIGVTRETVADLSDSELDDAISHSLGLRTMSAPVPTGAAPLWIPILESFK